ncbi:MAG: TonB-dependent receptor [Pseudomonadota bacterium]
MQRTPLAALIAGLFSLPVQAQDPTLLDEIVVTATRVPTADIAAPYASEVHTRRQIEKSAATTVYDYLAQHTSVVVMPSYGNRFTPKIDMRGYGIGDGYQNIVVTLDGRRLNNIDMAPQLLGAIPLGDIERIEITRGSGSVMFGDGATAGSIQIYTRQHTGVAVQIAAGNHGMRGATVSAGAAGERVDVSASAEYQGLDGYSDPDVTGHRDAASNRTWRGGLGLRPVERLKLDLEAASTRIDTRYPGALSQAAFHTNPAQNGGNTYTYQKFASDVWLLGAELELSKTLKLSARHSNEDKLSNYVSYSSLSNYDYSVDDLALQYRGQALDLTAGVQTFDGTRIGSFDRTSKTNTGWYAQGQYRQDRLTLSAGARTERVEYAYVPNSGTALHARHDLTAWDVGVNRQLDDRLSVFANYNQAFQAPDIDRFFTYGSFNAFIQPARSRTLNLGVNHVDARNRFKADVFYGKLKNEIYYYSTGNWATSYNTNIDKSHKYGLEMQDTWRISEVLSGSLNYTYTRAIIDREDSGGGSYNGKDLPGVSRHGVVLGLAYSPSKNASLNLTHAWRSTAWAAEDFDNNNAQKQAAYQSTDVAYRYRHRNLEWFASVENLFEHKNGLWILDDVVYPVNFTRNWRVGVKAVF